MLTLMIAALAFEAAPVPEAWPLIPGLGGTGRAATHGLAGGWGRRARPADRPAGRRRGCGRRHAGRDAWLTSYSLAEWRGGWDRLTGLAGTVRRTPSETPKRRKKTTGAWPEEPAGRAEPYLEREPTRQRRESIRAEAEPP